MKKKVDEGAIREYSMVMGRVAKLNENPIATVIVIAPLQKEAEKLAEKELEPYSPGYPYRMGFNWLGPIMWIGAPKTIFLHTNENGRIK
jgi:hypothetical protein